MHNRFFKGLALALTVATVMTSAMPVMADEIVEEVVVEEEAEVVTLSEDYYPEKNEEVSANFAYVSDNTVVEKIASSKEKANKKDGVHVTVVNGAMDTVSVDMLVKNGKVKSLTIKPVSTNEAVTLVAGAKYSIVLPNKAKEVAALDKKVAKAKINKKDGSVLVSLKGGKVAANQDVKIEITDEKDAKYVINANIENLALDQKKATIYSVSGEAVGKKDGKTISVNSTYATVSINLLAGTMKETDTIAAIWNVDAGKKNNAKIAELSKATKDTAVVYEIDKTKNANQTIVLTVCKQADATNKDAAKAAFKGNIKVSAMVNGKIYKATVKVANKIPKKM